MATTTKPNSLSERAPLRRFERLLTEISAKFTNLTGDELDAEIVNAQRSICQTLGLSESVLWQPVENEPNKLEMTHYYRESEPPPIPSPMLAEEYLPWAFRRMIANEVMCIRSLRDFPPEAARDAETFRLYGVKSSIAFPLYVAGDPLIGALSFDSLDEEQDFPEELQSRLSLLAQVFAGALVRRRRELSLRQSEARLALAAGSAGAGLWTLDVTSGKLWMTDTALSLFGFPEGYTLEYEAFFRLVHPDDRGRLRATIDRAVATGDEQSAQYRILRQDGRIRWVSSSGRTHSDRSGLPRLLMGVTVDVTEAHRAEERTKQLSRRLITAQEEERRRIARDLHDDIGQCIAIVCMRIQQIGDSILGMPTAKAELEAVGVRLGTIAQQISTLSHQLHSAELEYLGLQSAILTACREFASLKNIEVQTLCDPITAELSKTAELCLFRVLQESLRNVAKHSGAKNVRVRLFSTDHAVTLVVQDDGGGFDIQHGGESSGLGLISMRERMLMVHGHLEVSSSRGEGTSVSATVPFKTPTEAEEEPSSFTFAES